MKGDINNEKTVNLYCMCCSNTDDGSGTSVVLWKLRQVFA